MTIYQASFEDADEISRVHIEAERDTYRMIQPSLLEHVSGPIGRSSLWQVALGNTHLRTICLLLRDPSNTLVGFLAGSVPDEGSSARLNSLYVLRHHQRRGYGKKLLAAFATEASRRKKHALTCVIPSVNTSGRDFIAWSGGIETSLPKAPGSQDVVVTEYAWHNVDKLSEYLGSIR